MANNMGSIVHHTNKFNDDLIKLEYPKVSAFKPHSKPCKIVEKKPSFEHKPRTAFIPSEYRELALDVDLLAMKKQCDEIISAENKFCKAMQQLQDDLDYDNLRRKELIYQKWNEEVYFPLTKNVEMIMDKVYDTKVTERQKLYLKFLELVNEKQGVYLDTLQQGYDPLKLRSIEKSLLSSVRLQPLRDPLRMFERQKTEEDNWMEA